MKPMSQPRFKQMRMLKQRGLILFFALIALVVMSLAAVALVRSVDTSTMIAGNLAFKQSATTAADLGVEAAISWISTVNKNNSNMDLVNDPNHPFNQTDAAQGYYSNLSSVNITDGAGIKWKEGVDCVLVGEDQIGNTTRYIIQRLCRTANIEMKSAGCLYSGALVDPNGHQIKKPQEICSGDGCPAAGQSPQLRITVQSKGPKNTVSYVQTFVY